MRWQPGLRPQAETRDGMACRDPELRRRSAPRVTRYALTRGYTVGFRAVVARVEATGRNPGWCGVSRPGVMPALCAPGYALCANPGYTVGFRAVVARVEATGRNPGWCGVSRPRIAPAQCAPGYALCANPGDTVGFRVATTTRLIPDRGTNAIARNGSDGAVCAAPWLRSGESARG